MKYNLQGRNWAVGMADEFHTSFKLPQGRKRLNVKATVKGFKEVDYPKFLPRFIGKFFADSREYITITFTEPFIVTDRGLTDTIDYGFKNNLSLSWNIFEERKLPELLKAYKEYRKHAN